MKSWSDIEHFRQRQMKTCECEHVGHTEPGEHTPNGNPGHKYLAKYHDSYVKRVKTPYGVFQLCRDCAEDCYHTYIASLKDSDAT